MSRPTTSPDFESTDTHSEARLGATADGWLATGLVAVAADRAEAEAGVRAAFALAGLAEPDRFDWHGSPRSGVLAASH
jgi:hypothetical protein